MSESYSFAPDWLSPPGDTILELLKERELSPTAFAADLGRNSEYLGCLLRGQVPINKDAAVTLSKKLGSTVSFWLRREELYRADLARLQAEARRAVDAGWLKMIPLKEMIDAGWVESASNPEEQAIKCMHFFGIGSLDGWQATMREIAASVAFRTSPSFKSHPGAVAAWLREGERKTSAINCDPWDQDKLRSLLPEIRKLTREGNPQEFIPALQKECATCGVAVGILKAPKGCRASGAARFLSPNRAIILLSFRYLSDDHFWFSFFHEAGHLLLHPDRGVAIDAEDAGTSKEEDEANEFSQNVLIPERHQQELLSLDLDVRSIARFAKSIGVSVGVVVGQLQHQGRVRPNQLHGLRRRFKWA